MSAEYATIAVARKEMTSELIQKILDTEFSDTSVQYIDDHLARQNERRIENGEAAMPIPDTLLEKVIMYQAWRADGTLVFSGETYADDHMGEEACQLLRDAGVTYEFYLANDETDADETIWSPNGCVKYDVSKEGHPVIPLVDIEKIMRGKTDKEKVQLMEQVFYERSSYGMMTPAKIANQNKKEISKIDEILEMLDAGAITQNDAFEQIKMLKGA